MASQYLANADMQFRNSIIAALRRVPFTNLNQPLYHFTDINGVTGILETRSLWASQAMDLEDTSEIKYALERAKGILQRCTADDISSLLNDVVSLLDPVNSRVIDTLGMKTYIVSFRTNVDDCTHWEKFGKAGKGYALAFAPKLLVIPGVLLIPVLYDPVAQDKLLDEFIESNIKLFAELRHKCPQENLRQLRQRTVQFTALGLWTFAPVLKDPFYRREEEWRLIIIDLEQVQLQYAKGLTAEVKKRHHNGHDIRYKILRYEVLPIVRIELGQDATTEMGDVPLKQLLQNATRFDVPIVRSQMRESPKPILNKKDT